MSDQPRVSEEEIHDFRRDLECVCHESTMAATRDSVRKVAERLITERAAMRKELKVAANYLAESNCPIWAAEMQVRWGL